LRAPATPPAPAATRRRVTPGPALPRPGWPRGRPALAAPAWTGEGKARGGREPRDKPMAAGLLVCSLLLQEGKEESVEMEALG